MDYVVFIGSQGEWNEAWSSGKKLSLLLNNLIGTLLMMIIHVLLSQYLFGRCVEVE